MSVRNGFTIEIYTGLCIVYVPFGTCRSGCHRAIIKVEDSEDRRRRQNESRCMEDDKITVTRNNLRVTTRVIYFTR